MSMRVTSLAPNGLVDTALNMVEDNMPSENRICRVLSSGIDFFSSARDASSYTTVGTGLWATYEFFTVEDENNNFTAAALLTSLFGFVAACNVVAVHLTKVLYRRFCRNPQIIMLMVQDLNEVPEKVPNDVSIHRQPNTFVPAVRNHPLRARNTHVGERENKYGPSTMIGLAAPLIAAEVLFGAPLAVAGAVTLTVAHAN